MAKLCFAFLLCVVASLCCIAAVPDGNYLYVANYASNDVYTFRIENSGSLTFLGSIAAGVSPWPLAMDPGGRYLFAGNAVSNDISIYRIGADGLLSALTPRVAAGPRPFSLAVDATGRFLYAGLESTKTIAAFRIDSGNLIPVGTFPTGDTPTAMAVSRAGFLYVANINSSDIWSYRIEQNGSLTPVGSPLKAAGTYPHAIAVLPKGELAVVGSKNAVMGLRIGPDGAVSSVTQTMPNSGSPVSVTVHPQGSYVYVTNDYGGTVQVFRVMPNGSLLQTGIFSGGNRPVSSATDDKGRFLFVADREANRVAGFHIDSTGALSPNGTWPAGATPMSTIATRCTLPPVIERVTAVPVQLWPPNGTMRMVTIDYSVTESCGQTQCWLFVAGPASPTSTDSLVLDAHRVLLRAERGGRNESKQYAVTIGCRDIRGNEASHVVTVSVPHDLGR